MNILESEMKTIIFCSQFFPKLFLNPKWNYFLFEGIAKVRQECEDKIGILKNNYENNLLSIQSGYEQDIEKQKQEIKTLNTELNSADKEIDALRQSLEALEHENQSLRLSINNNNKQFANIKLIKNRNKQLTAENETLRLQIEGLEQGMEILMAEQEQIERENDDSLYLNSHNTGTKQNPNQRPQTPSHGYTKTVMMGHRDQLELNPAKSNSAHALLRYLWEKNGNLTKK